MYSCIRRAAPQGGPYVYTQAAFAHGTLVKRKKYFSVSLYFRYFSVQDLLTVHSAGVRSAQDCLVQRFLRNLALLCNRNFHPARHAKETLLRHRFLTAAQQGKIHAGIRPVNIKIDALMRSFMQALENSKRFQS